MKIPEAPTEAPSWFRGWIASMRAATFATRFPDGRMPVLLPVYTKANLPSAAQYVNALIAVSDGVSNKRLAISDGTNWRFPDGNVVS